MREKTSSGVGGGLSRSYLSEGVPGNGALSARWANQSNTVSVLLRNFYYNKLLNYSAYYLSDELELSFNDILQLQQLAIDVFHENSITNCLLD